MMILVIEIICELQRRSKIKEANLALNQDFIAWETLQMY